MNEGALIDARHRELQGEAAAVRIIGWASPAVTIINTCATRQRTIDRPIGFIVMEAMRVSDEAKRGGAAGLLSLLPPLDRVASAPPGDAMPFSLRPSSSLSDFPLTIPDNAHAIAIVEAASGRIRSAAGTFERLEAVAQLVADVYTQEAAAVALLASDDAIEELVITTRRYWIVARPLALQPPSLAFLVFDPQRANSALERMELAAFARRMQSWSSVQLS